MRRSRQRGSLVANVALGALILLAAVVLAYGWASDFGRQEEGPAGPQEQGPADAGPQEQGPAVYQHLVEFQALADEHGDRAMGTSGYEAAAEYVEEQLEDAGYESWRQYFTFHHRGEEYESFNVIAETEAGSDDEVVMLGAHLDSVPDSPGINDNASGVAAVLEAAKEVAGQEEVNRTVRFAFWGAEEYPRTPGSRHYVEELEEYDEDELDRIVAYLNFDMVASPNPVIGVYNARETDSRLDVPEGSEQVMDVFTDYFDSREQPWVPTGWNFASDQVAFVREGVAVGGLFTGSEERKTSRQARLFGGTAGEPRDPNYHRSGDDLDNVDLEALELMTDAITHAATALAEDTSPLDEDHEDDGYDDDDGDYDGSR